MSHRNRASLAAFILVPAAILALAAAIGAANAGMARLDGRAPSLLSDGGRAHP